MPPRNPKQNKGDKPMTNQQQLKEKIIKDWEKEFDKDFVDPNYPLVLWDFIRTEELKSFIRQLLAQETQKTRTELLDKVEKTMRDTLSADTLKYHNEVDLLYEKLDELRDKSK